MIWLINLPRNIVVRPKEENYTLTKQSYIMLRKWSKVHLLSYTKVWGTSRFIGKKKQFFVKKWKRKDFSLNPFQKIAKDLLFLENFRNLNMLAFVKILKKFDKVRVLGLKILAYSIILVLTILWKNFPFSLFSGDWQRSSSHLFKSGGKLLLQ